jgi:ethanolamine phosphate phosphodiesterase
MTTISLRPTLCILWFALVLYGELGTFVCSLADCTWPKHSPHTASTHVLVIADPQILDMQSYPDRPWVLQWISRLMTDLNMRKSWWATRRHLKPDVLVFLGDMMDRGRIEMPQVE